MNLRVQRLGSLGLVLALHAGAIYGLWNAQLIPSPLQAATLFVNFIAPSDSKDGAEPKRSPEAKPKPKSKPRPMEAPQPRQQAVAISETAPGDVGDSAAPVKPELTQAIAATALVVQAALPGVAVALSTELSVVCPDNVAARYPLMSRRRNESGVVVLRVELAESGAIVAAQVQSSSGFERLDNAALAAVRTWHCTPPTYNGQPVRATALQPFIFKLKD